jgi:hypothetical protein
MLRDIQNIKIIFIICNLASCTGSEVQKVLIVNIDIQNRS